jgi:hypothetical protein
MPIPWPVALPVKQAGAARIVLVEYAPDQLSRGVETGDRLVREVEHPSVGVDLEPAESEGDPAGHDIAVIGRLIDRQSPVGLGHLEALGGYPVEDRGVVPGLERVFRAGRVELGDGLLQPLGIDVELLGEPLDGVGRRLGHLADAVFVADVVVSLGIEDLHRGALGLLHHLLAVLGIGVIAVVGAFVDEPLAIQVHYDPDRVGMLLKVVEHHPVAIRRGRNVPLHRVA